MPLLERPELPTQELARGQARLLAHLSLLGEGEGEATGEDDGREAGLATELGDDGRGSWPAVTRDPEGRYELGEVFAAGGLGVVRHAHDRRLRRAVAVKQLRRDTPEAARRFALEAAITARLQHPSIVPLYDLVWDEQAKPYYCMKRVEGETLEAEIEARETLAERLRFVEQVIDVADAIAYAHEQQIIHRDIKPANVLLGEFGETVVIDWGLAKDLSGEIVAELALAGEAEDAEGEAREAPLDMTEAGTIMGTLRYMSPEQARGEAVDTRGDIYSLGALLYHVLAGMAPFGEATREQLVARVLAGQTARLRELDEAIPAELVAIAERAMHLDPAERYASAQDFAADLRAFQTGRMVSAHDYSPAEVARRWLRRNRISVGASALALLGVGAVGLFALGQVRAERLTAEQAEAEAAAQAQRAEQVAFEGAVLDEARRAVEVLELAQTPERELEALALGVELVAAHGEDYAAVPEPVYQGLSRALGGMIPVARLDAPARRVFSAGAFSPDGSRLVTLPWMGDSGEGRDRLQVWSTAQGRVLGELELPELDGARDSSVTAFSPDNRLLALSGRTSCRVIELESHTTLAELEGCAEPRFSTDGALLFAKLPGAVEDQVQLYAGLGAWAVGDWSQRWTADTGGKNLSYLVHPDGERLIARHDHSHSQPEAIELLDARSGERLALLAREHEGARSFGSRSPGFSAPHNLALSIDGSQLAVSETHEGGQVVVWSLAGEAEGRARVLDLAGGIPRYPLFAADGRRLFVGGPSLEVYDPRSGHQQALFPAPAQPVRTQLGALGLSGGAWLELASGRAAQAAPTGRMRALESSPDGAFVVSVDESRARLWSAADHLALERWKPPAGQRVVAFSPAQIVTETFEGLARVYERSQPDAAPTPAYELGVLWTRARASKQVSIVALPTNSEGREGIDIVDLRTGRSLCRLAELAPGSHGFALDPEGKTFVLSHAGVAHLWDVERCRERGTLQVHAPDTLRRGEGPDYRFASNGALLMHRSGVIEIHGSGGQRVTIEDGCAVHNPWGDAMLSPDGRHVLSWCSSGPGASEEIRVWDLTRREQVASIDARSYEGVPVFSADSQRLVFIAGARELAVVDVDSGREQLRIRTQAIDATFAKLGASEDPGRVEVYTNTSELVSYPITRAGVVEAACAVLARSELAERAELACGE